MGQSFLRSAVCIDITSLCLSLSVDLAIYLLQPTKLNAFVLFFENKCKTVVRFDVVNE